MGAKLEITSAICIYGADILFKIIFVTVMFICMFRFLDCIEDQNKLISKQNELITSYISSTEEAVPETPLPFSKQIKVKTHKDGDW